MSRKTIILSSILLAFGCGGGGGTSTPSPFAGTFAGPWTSTSGQSGTSNITVADSGNVAGSIVNTTLGANGSIAGSIQANGNIAGSYQYPGQAPISFTGTLTLSNGGANLGGALIGGGTTATFTLTRQ